MKLLTITESPQIMAAIRHKATDTLEKRPKMPRSVSTSLGLKYLVTGEKAFMCISILAIYCFVPL